VQSINNKVVYNFNFKPQAHNQNSAKKGQDHMDRDMLGPED